jgi:DNA-directed RNA polymerase subunit alpha
MWISNKTLLQKTKDLLLLAAKKIDRYTILYTTSFLPMFHISCKESRVEHARSFYGCFVLGPFEAGQSLTIANTLRRTLLSDLPGVGIRSIEVYGAKHGYASLPGVQESMLDVIMNFKQLVLRPTGSEPSLELVTRPQLAYLNIRGPGKVKASHLQLPPFLQCVDPEQIIANLMGDGSLKVKCWIQLGKNYTWQQNWSHLAAPHLRNLGLQQQAANQSSNLPAESVSFAFANDTSTMSESDTLLVAETGPSGTPMVSEMGTWKPAHQGRFELDSILMPVQQVNYLIQPSEIWPDEHKIMLEIWTNGSLHPRQALAIACKQLIRVFCKLDRSVLWLNPPKS